MKISLESQLSTVHYVNYNLFCSISNTIVCETVESNFTSALFHDSL